MARGYQIVGVDAQLRQTLVEVGRPRNGISPRTVRKRKRILKHVPEVSAYLQTISYRDRLNTYRELLRCLLITRIIERSNIGDRY